MAAAPIVSAPTAAVSTSAAAAVVAGFTTRDMLSRLNQPWVQLIDVRPAQEYAGRDIRTLRGGHIPGAINLPIERASFDPANLSSKVAGLDPRKETIVYGNDAADAARFAELLEREGFLHVRLYAAGWPAWADALELPVTNERFADVGSLRRQIDELQAIVASYSAPSDHLEPIAGSSRDANR